jgi:hypothetical protein
MTSLKGLSNEISHHFLGGAPFNLNLLHVDPVSNEKISSIDMPSLLTT